MTSFSFLVWTCFLFSTSMNQVLVKKRFFTHEEIVSVWCWEAKHFLLFYLDTADNINQSSNRDLPVEADMSSFVANDAAASSSGARAWRGGRRSSGLMRFKGVVVQQNGHWGAQIYANHQRIWLGTFRSEDEAARAYDSAAIRIRSGDAHRNFPWTPATLHEPAFQANLSTDQLLAMIKDGSYRTKFEEYLTSHVGDVESGGSEDGNERERLSLKQLFKKELTPSDVGKLNRLVIPKKHAVKHFPRVAAASGDTLMVVRDAKMRTWKLRYCYWKSSQSFVFTRGWSAFVKEKQLRERDTLVFYAGEDSGRPVFVIDVVRVGGESTIDRGSGSVSGNGELVSLELKAGMKRSAESEAIEREGSVKKNKGFMLFGVQISS